jgi:hypothetical protein
LSKKSEAFSEQKLKFLVAGEKKKKVFFFVTVRPSRFFHKNSCAILKEYQSARKVGRHSKNDPLLCTILKESMESLVKCNKNITVKSYLQVLICTEKNKFEHRKS